MSKVLLIVDMQKDFMPEMLWSEQSQAGALPVANGLQIVPNIVKEAFSAQYDLIVATRDFHPGNHCSFKELGGDWPMHCVAGSEGAQLLNEIDMVADIIISKGTDASQEAYSGFQTPTESLGDMLLHLNDLEIPEVVICGVATEYCVKATALDSLYWGFPTTVLLDCVAGVIEDDAIDALLEMDEAGITLRQREG